MIIISDRDVLVETQSRVGWPVTIDLVLHLQDRETADDDICSVDEVDRHQDGQHRYHQSQETLH
jgi:hypothetical protein